jgi:hypothetical protein
VSAPLGPVGVAVLTGATWAVLAIAYAVHHWLNRRWPVRQATHLTHQATKDKP